MTLVRPRFLADCNVGRLARWLRALGYDASYHARIDDSELVREAAAENRVVLTRDRDLTKRRVIQTGVVRAILIRDDDVTKQLRQVFGELGLELKEALTRCIECNSELESRAAAEAASMDVVVYHTSARVLRPGFLPEASDGKVAILTAGTSDLPAADEARMVIESCGVEARLEADLGVAGLHRFVGPLAAALEWGADVIIVAAGMDGVLPGLVAGLIDLPVIGLPVSTGYGHGSAGEGALTTTLTL